MTYTVRHTDYAGGNPGEIAITAGSASEAIRTFYSVMPYGVIKVLVCPGNTLVWGIWP